MSATTIKVWPTKASAVDLKHPHGPALAFGGVDWPEDTFTMRRLRDGSASLDPKMAFKPAEPPRTPGGPAEGAPAAPAESIIKA